MNFIKRKGKFTALFKSIKLEIKTQSLIYKYVCPNQLNHNNNYKDATEINIHK